MKVVTVRVALAVESVGYATPPMLEYVETVERNDSGLPKRFTRLLRYIRSEECLVYHLCREDQPDYTVLLSWEPVSPDTCNKRSLQLIVVPVKLI